MIGKLLGLARFGEKWEIEDWECFMGKIELNMGNDSEFIIFYSSRQLVTSSRRE